MESARPTSASPGLKPPSVISLSQERHCLLKAVDELRRVASGRLDDQVRRALGQFFTPTPVARMMAAMFGPLPEHVTLLDPGAGVGILTAAFVEEACGRERKPRKIEAVAFELDTSLHTQLRQAMRLCERFAQTCGVEFAWQVRGECFLEAGRRESSPEMFNESGLRFSHVIANPPYRKIGTSSRERLVVSKAGLETSNLYTAFLYLSCQMLLAHGVLVAITPRSFCNGPYFFPFRSYLNTETCFTRIHVFAARDRVFGGDAVLQENVVFALQKEGRKAKVAITSSVHPDDERCLVNEIEHKDLMRADDPELFIRLVLDSEEKRIEQTMSRLASTLGDLGVEVSTGRVVDFRARGLLRSEWGPAAVPLIYPGHFEQGSIRWPRPGFKKPNAIVDDERSARLLVPSGNYVLVKRFTAKEEARRVVAALLTPDHVKGPRFGFENHLNYFHGNAEGLDRDLAAGLCLFLNSTLVDRHFRQFNGHTQVNAADLRSMRYPPARTLCRMGKKHPTPPETQSDLDRIIAREVAHGG